MSGELPEGWLATTLSEFLDAFEAGRNLRAEGRPAGDGEYGVLKISAVTWGAFRPEENKALLPEDKPRPHEVVRQGDLLISRANTSELVGAVVLVDQDHPRLMLPDKVLRLRLKPGTIDPHFALHALRTAAVRAHFRANATGTSDSMRNLAQPKISAAPIAVAPVSEQRRIVEKVEELLGQVVRATARLNRVNLILQRFRQAVLAAACSGELTREWRIDEPETAGSLLSALGAARVRDEAKPDLDLPTSWRWAATQSLCEPSRSITYGVIKLGEPVANGVPTLRSSDVRPLFIDDRSVKRIAPAIASQYTRTFLKGGEVLVTVRGTLGGVAVVPPHMAGFNISREVAQLPLRPEINANYVALAVASITSQNWLGERTKGAAYTGINIEDLRQLPIPLPPRREQDEIVLAARRLLALADNIKKRVQAASMRAEKLPEAILAKAFAGELVPTEAELARAEARSFETAAEVLQRLRAESEDHPRREPKTRVVSSMKKARSS